MVGLRLLRVGERLGALGAEMRASRLSMVIRLDASRRGEVFLHLHSLPGADRRLRFAAALDDAAIARYVSGIDFLRDRVFGICGGDAALRGVAHLALPRHGDTAEVGLSVAPGWRGRGYGTALLAAARDEAARLGWRKLHIEFLAENRVMVHVARKVGMRLVCPLPTGAYLALGAGAARSLPAMNSC